MLLSPLSMLMRVLVAVRRQAFHRGWMKSTRLPVPVLVVRQPRGGRRWQDADDHCFTRTPAVTRGWRPGVLSRGYKAEGGGAWPVLIDTQTASSLQAQATGDEPMLIWRRTGAPVMVGRDRAGKWPCFAEGASRDQPACLRRWPAAPAPAARSR
ncbi:MAG: tetraacyldisaccharide 4'-kinase, partial [Aquabacterium sp.]